MIKLKKKVYYSNKKCTNIEYLKNPEGQLLPLATSPQALPLADICITRIYIYLHFISCSFNLFYIICKRTLIRV